MEFWKGDSLRKRWYSELSSSNILGSNFLAFLKIIFYFLFIVVTLLFLFAFSITLAVVLRNEWNDVQMPEREQDFSRYIWDKGLLLFPVQL